MSLKDDFNGQRWLTIEENSDIVKNSEGGGGVLYLTITDNSLGKSYNDIVNAINAGKAIILKETYSEGNCAFALLNQYFHDEISGYGVLFIVDEVDTSFTSATADGVLWGQSQ